MTKDEFINDTIEELNLISQECKLGNITIKASDAEKVYILSKRVPYEDAVKAVIDEIAQKSNSLCGH